MSLKCCVRELVLSGGKRCLEPGGTMSVSRNEVDMLVKYCETNLGDKALWKNPCGYPNSLALCIIDAIYSTGSHYTSVVNVTTRYKESEGLTDGAAGLLRSFAEAGGARNWAATVADNHKPAHTRIGARVCCTDG